MGLTTLEIRFFQRFLLRRGLKLILPGVVKTKMDLYLLHVLAIPDGDFLENVLYFLC